MTGGTSVPPPKGEPPRNGEELTEAEAGARLRTLSRRGFAVAGAAALGTLLGWRWLLRQATREDDLAWPLRRALETNREISEALFSSRRLAPTFSREAVGVLRPNGTIGLKDADFRLEGWRLQAEGLAGGAASFSLAELQALPHAEMTTEFKCIEGWSTVAHWAGVRLADFARAHPPPTRSGRRFDPERPDDAPPYLSLETPDEEYYVGLDTASALHPQTLLAWALNGEPLSEEHGAPLRLVIPVKYGIKNLKRIGTLAWTTRQPADYWAELGYDWFAGL